MVKFKNTIITGVLITSLGLLAGCGDDKNIKFEVKVGPDIHTSTIQKDANDKMKEIINKFTEKYDIEEYTKILSSAEIENSANQDVKLQKLDYEYKLDFFSSNKNYKGRIEYINILPNKDINDKMLIYKGYKDISSEYAGKITNSALRLANLKYDKNDSYAGFKGDKLKLLLIDGKFTGVYTSIKNNTVTEYVSPEWKTTINRVESID